MDFDGTFIVVFISFVFFTVLMRSWYFEPIRAIRTERENKIEGDKKKADLYNRELADMQEHYKTEIQGARKDAQKVLADIRQKAKQKAAMQVNHSRENAARDLDKQLGKLAVWRDEIYQELSNDRNELTDSIVSKITAKTLVSAKK